MSFANVNKGKLLAWYFVFSAIPPACYTIYDYFKPLPHPFTNIPYPFIARFWIRKSFWGRFPEDKIRDIDFARKAIMRKDIGPASPQATQLLVYDVEERLKLSPSIETLKMLWGALTAKPHVGEGASEERARLETAFKVAAMLCDRHLEYQEASKAKDLATNVMFYMDKSPSYLSSQWTKHPLRAKFEALTAK